MDEHVASATQRGQAQRNRATFDATLEGYVGQKLAYSIKQLEQGERELWFDATDCVWCVFDDPEFERCEDVADSDAERPSDLQVYWSLGHVVMPASCDVTWVAQRIADEAIRQFEERGYRCHLEERSPDGQVHVGVSVRRFGVIARLVRRFS